MKSYNRILSIIVFLTSLCWFYTGFAQDIIEGIDVSEYQGDIDFSQVSNAGIDTVYIRAAGGEEIDSYFEQNYSKARSAGLKIGFYHYITPNSSIQAQNQAEFFYELIKDKTMDCYPAMDYESFGQKDEEQINQIALSYMQTLERLWGNTPAIYSDASNVSSLWREDLAKYPLWIADYSTEMPEETGVWTDWAGFQYTDMGQVNGIAGNVDRDLFRSLIFIEGGNSGETDGEGSDTLLYVIQYGDTLSEIALRFGTTVGEIAALNGIENPNLIYAGETLEIPKSTNGKIIYVVRRGDTLSEIALRFGTTVGKIAALNGIENPNLIYAGETLEIPKSTNGGIIYVVRSGDTLSEIALRFGTTVGKIAALNGIENPDIIYAGQSILI